MMTDAEVIEKLNKAKELEVEVESYLRSSTVTFSKTKHGRGMHLYTPFKVENKELRLHPTIKDVSGVELDYYTDDSGQICVDSKVPLYPEELILESFKELGSLEQKDLIIELTEFFYKNVISK